MGSFLKYCFTCRTERPESKKRCPVCNSKLLPDIPLSEKKRKKKSGSFIGDDVKLEPMNRSEEEKSKKGEEDLSYEGLLKNIDDIKEIDSDDVANTEMLLKIKRAAKIYGIYEMNDQDRKEIIEYLKKN